jgi:DNA polymerase III epsilon subunit-like protein
MLHYYLIDTETTGLCEFHEINEISIIRYADKFQKTIKIKVDHPEKADKRALEIQGKTKYDLQKGIHRSEAVEQLDEFILEDGATPNARIICGHNIQFDARFINKTWAKDNKIFPAEMWLCTMAMTRKLAKKQGLVKPKVNLKAALAIAGVQEKAGQHTAAVDIFNTMKLFEKLMEHNLDHLSLIKSYGVKKKVSTGDEQYEDFE